MKSYIKYDQLIDEFICSFVKYYNGVYVPKINFVFKEDAINYFKYLVDHPVKINENEKTTISFDDIECLMKQDKNAYTIKINNYKLFFTYLMNNINEFVTITSRRSLKLKFYISNIWLKMNSYDLFHPEEFLIKEYNNLLDDTFDNIDKVDNFLNYDIYGSVYYNELWNETDKNMRYILISEDNKIYYLPVIHFELDKFDGEKICIIKAIQSMSKLKKQNSKSIERKLYTLYNDKKKNIHPNRYLAINLFFNDLIKLGINDIIIDTDQVLSYDYHKILSRDAKNDFLKNWSLEKIMNIKYCAKSKFEYLCEKYEYDLNWCYNIIDKEDFILKNKTIELVNAIKETIIDREDVSIIEENNNNLYLKINKNKIYKKK